MTLSEIEKKLLMLAMDRSATNDEVTAAAKKFIESMRKQFPSGVELINSIEGRLSAGVGVSPSFRQAATMSAWGDIMREAQQFGRNRAAAAAHQQQQSWEEYCRTAGQQQQQYTEQQQQWFARQQQQYRPPKNQP